ncbi:MAG: hypothetical protein U5J62_02775 [Desulfurivibrio sp.]|nr:hypothetical protein [Desulfurivibrio sp.]
MAAALARSLENDVTMMAVDRIANKRHHFYEVPVPEEFIGAGRRTREISVAMAHTPYVRSTRIAYKATRMDFRLVAAEDLDHAATMFNRATDRDEYERIPELSKPDVGPQSRDKGTVQAAELAVHHFQPPLQAAQQTLIRCGHQKRFPLGGAPQRHGRILRPRALATRPGQPPGKALYRNKKPPAGTGKSPGAGLMAIG